MLPCVPMFHANAWGYPYLAAMLGAKIVFPGPLMDPHSLLEAFEQPGRAGLVRAAAATMFTEELGISPHVSPGTAAFHARIRGLIDDG